jgi:pyruvate kinase
MICNVFIIQVWIGNLQFRKAHNITILCQPRKIENQEGINNIDQIIEATDGVMVARVGLGARYLIRGLEDAFALQPAFCKKGCSFVGGIVYTCSLLNLDA